MAEAEGGLNRPYDTGRTTPAGAGPAADPRTPDQIRADIDRERGELDVLLAALANKLSPSAIGDQVWSKMRSKLDTGELARSAKEHPIPLALVGAGLAWLFYESTSAKANGKDHRSWIEREASDEVEQPIGATYGPYDPASPGFGASGEIAGMEHDESGRLGTKVHAMTDGAREKLAHVKQRAGELPGRTRQVASQAGEKLHHVRQRAGEGYEQMMQSNPFALGTLALGAGLLCGLAVPTSRVEDELMGEASERVKEEARHAKDEAMRVAAEKVEKGAHVAQAAASAAAEATRDARPDEPLGERARAAATAAKDAARSRAEHEGLRPRGDGAAERPMAPGSEALRDPYGPDRDH